MDTVKGKKINRITVPDLESLSRAALDFFIKSANEKICQNNPFHVAISGGHTPERFYQLIESDPEAQKLPWNQFHLFWVDERAVPPDDKDSNYHMASEAFLQKVSMPEDHVHRILGEVSDLTRAAKDYEKVIRDIFQLKPGQMPEFDLIVLGMGSDGHVASIMPNSWALLDTDDLVSIVFRMEGDWSRVTITVPVLLAAKKMIILISGKEKADIVKRVFNGEPDVLKYPVYSLWPALDRIIWILDEPAASGLSD